MSQPTAKETSACVDLNGTSAPVCLRAPAKINLTLAILGKRADEFHELESLVIPLALYDDLEFTERPEGIELSCDDASLPAGPDNLIWRAAERMAERTPRPRGVRIRLAKRIPVGAGLGGGSSDAAATLVGLNRLWGLDLAKPELAELAAGLGSDVPLFLERGPSIIRGRGERVEPVALRVPGWIVLVLPPFGMDTAEVYSHWRAEQPPPRSAAQVVQDNLAGRPLDELLYNMLERPAFAVEPRLAELHAELIRLRAKHSRMSGSGSGFFVLFGELDQAQSFAAQAAQQLDVTVHVIEPALCEHL